MCESFAFGASTPQSSRVRSGRRSRVFREGCEARCIIPHPTPWRSASALAPRISSSEQVPKPSSSGHADTSPRSPAVHLLEHRLVRAQGLPGGLAHALGPRLEIPGPAPEDRPHAEALHRSRHRGRLEERARLAEGGGAGADHLDAGQERGVLLVLRGHDRVERDEPVGQVAVHRDVVEQQPAVEMLGEMHVGVHEAGRDHHPPRVDHPVRHPRRTHLARGPHLDDLGPVDQHGSVGEDPPPGIHRDDGAVLDEDHDRRATTRCCWLPRPSIPIATTSPSSR